MLADMQKHIQELDDTITSGMTDRTMMIVQEIVKMLEEEQSKEEENQKSDVDKMMEAAETSLNSIAGDEDGELLEKLEKTLVHSRLTLDKVKADNTAVLERLEQLGKMLMEKLTKMPDNVNGRLREK